MSASLCIAERLVFLPSCDVEERLLDGGQVEENEPLFVKPKEDESDSKSSRDDLEGGSGDDNEGANRRSTKKKHYHRHTLHQIQEMERFFKECPHPDEKQRGKNLAKSSSFPPGR